MPSENPAIQKRSSAQPKAPFRINHNTGTTSAMRSIEIALGIQFSDMRFNASGVVEKIQRAYRVLELEVAGIDSFLFDQTLKAQRPRKSLGTTVGADAKTD